jgi:flavin reductase (DIM6/NTAB) family NADH-FMN oxidoreductase RutF
MAAAGADGGREPEVTIKLQDVGPPGALPAIGPGGSRGRPRTGTAGRSLADDCRSFMSGYPTGVVVVTSTDADGAPVGLTCCTLISVSLAPPTLLVSINVRSRTLEAIRTREAFGVNLLRAAGRRAAEVFSSPRGDRFSAVQWEPSGGLRMPRLTNDAFGFCECVVAEDVRVLGDHGLVIGQVTAARCTSDAPLLYGLRQFAAWRPDFLQETSCAI